MTLPHPLTPFINSAFRVGGASRGRIRTALIAAALLVFCLPGSARAAEDHYEDHYDDTGLSYEIYEGESYGADDHDELHAETVEIILEDWVQGDPDYKVIDHMSPSDMMPANVARSAGPAELYLESLVLEPSAPETAEPTPNPDNVGDNRADDSDESGPHNKSWWGRP